MNKVIIAILILASFKLSYGQTWDAEEWGSDIETAIMVKDTFIFNGFSVIDERQIERKVRAIDTLVEEYYYPFNIESIKDNSDSTMVLMSRSSDLFIRHNYKGFEIKARQGIETAVLYIGELCSSDTVWLDTITFNVLLLERLTSFFHQDSICVPRLLYNQEIFGGLGHGMCTWIVPCIITEFKIEIRGRRIKAKFNINGNVVPIETINTFKKLEFDDIVTFYDIVGITRQYKTKVQFKPSQLIIKPCDR